MSKNPDTGANSLRLLDAGYACSCLPADVTPLLSRDFRMKGSAYTTGFGKSDATKMLFIE